MSRLNAFLHPVDLGEVKEVIISSRFKDEAGNPVPFTIRAITQEQNDAMTAKCRRVRTVRGQRQEYLDVAQLNRELIVAATLEPDFSSAEVCEAYGTKIPTQVLRHRHCGGGGGRGKKLIGGDSPDGEALIAYYCFVNLGWPPSKYEALPYRERLLVAAMVCKEINSRPKAPEKGG